MYKIAVIGDRDSIYGFASLGLEIFPTESIEEGLRILRKLAETDYAVIYITEELCSGLREELERYSTQIMPAIIAIPGVKGNTGVGIAMVKKSVERAVGSDIIFGNNQ